MRQSTHYWIIGIILSFLLGAPLACDRPGQEVAQQPVGAEIEFYDARRQAEEFIGYYRSIVLTAEQEETKREALSAIRAPCCNNYSIATCCCPCNLAKSVWGLAHLLIAQRGCAIEEVRDEVENWIEFINSAGYVGDACYKNRCSRSFSEDGCGGMNEGRVL